jgi:hypothetical protein
MLIENEETSVLPYAQSKMNSPLSSTAVLQIKQVLDSTGGSFKVFDVPEHRRPESRKEVIPAEYILGGR